MAMKATSVEVAARSGFVTSLPYPSSSRIIVSSQTCRSEVMTSTIRSRSSPQKPLAA